MLHRMGTATAVGLALVSAAVGASPAMAANAPPAARAQEATPADFDAWLSRLMAWNSQYMVLVTRRGDQMLALLDVSETLQAHLQRGDTREAKRWADAWATETRTAYAELNAIYPTLPVDPPAPPRVRGSEEQGRAALRQQVELRDRIGTLLRQTTDSADQFIDSVVTASSGRETDLQALGRAHFALGMAQLNIEILMIASSRPAQGEPAYHFSVALEEANHAALAWMRFIQADAEGQPSDPAGSAAAIRTRAAAAAGAAQNLKRDITRLRTEIEAERQLVGTPLKDTLLFICTSMMSSADIELRIAAQLEIVASAVAADDAEASMEAYDAIDKLVVERLETDRLRRARVSGG